MTPKEKATELTCKYFNLIFLDLDYDQAQQCALIAVDELINDSIANLNVNSHKYWEVVKKEIEAL